MVCPSGEMALKRIHNGLVCAVAPIASSTPAIMTSLLLIFIFVNLIWVIICGKGSQFFFISGINVDTNE